MDLNLSDQSSSEALSINKIFPKLKKLNLEENPQLQILTIQPKLNDLNISNCELTTFPEIILEMPSLSTLSTMQNCFSSFPQGIKRMEGLKDFSFDLSLLREKDVQVLMGLSKLTTLRLNLEHTSASDIEPLLLVKNWTKLYLNKKIEDMFVGKKILERENLKLFEMNEEKINIKMARTELCISL